MKYSQHYNTKQTPQSEPIPNRDDQVQNNANGYVFGLDRWNILDRFLTIGTEGGTYYVGEHDLTVANAKNVIACIKGNGAYTISRLHEISVEGRAPSNDPALFVLALCQIYGDKETKQHVKEVFNEVVRTGTHLLHFVDTVDALRGWGRGLKTLVSKWYEDKNAKNLAYQVAKYQQRDKWSHFDVLRKAHPRATTAEHSMIYNWIWHCRGRTDLNVEREDQVRRTFIDATDATESLEYIWAWEQAKKAGTVKQIINLIKNYRLGHENVPNEFKNDPRVWEALLECMPMTAMIRNLGKMSNAGLVVQGSAAARFIQLKLTDKTQLHRSRIHPISVLSALRTYQSGHGLRGSLTWEPVTRIVDALDDAFYMTFKNVEPTNKSLCLALDVSGSMGWSASTRVGLTPREISAAMALVTANIEKDYEIVAFSGQMIPLDISPKQRLDTVINTISNLDFGITDCALPMMWALGMNTQKSRSGGLEYKLMGQYHKTGEPTKFFDAFIVYTDSETWAGQTHPVQALQQYRREVNPTAKLIVNAMEPTEFTIADPKDPGMLDVSGFDSATPKVMSDFIRK